MKFPEAHVAGRILTPNPQQVLRAPPWGKRGWGLPIGGQSLLWRLDQACLILRAREIEMVKVELRDEVS